jgi:dephospho-CoA kinase
VLRLKKIAITGTVSSGKSEVCKILKSQSGTKVVSTDEIVHRLLSQDTNLIEQVIELLGQDVVEGHQLNRSLIAKKVFSHPERLKSLEALIHPKVFEEVEKEAKLAEKRGISLFIVEVPLLFEGDFASYFDKTVAVIADVDIRRDRFFDKSSFDSRNRSQLTDEQKANLADCVIENNGTLEQLKFQVLSLFKGEI